MKKILLIISSFLFCGISFSQIITPVTPTVYGSHFNRVKVDSALHIPEKNGLTTNSNDTTAQIFYNRTDSSFWGYSRIRGYFKVGSGNTKYVKQGYATKVDSAGNVYTVSVDTTLLKDSSYAKAPLKAIGDTLTLNTDTIPVRLNYIGVSTGMLAANSLVPKSYVDSLHAAGGGSTWGGITGTLSSQTDLQTALNAKENSLGNPSTNGYVLSSTTGGVRSWMAPGTGGGGSADVKQIYTGSSSVLVADSTTWLIINPSSLSAAITVTMPVSPTDKQRIEISFGGTITSGNGVVTTLTVSPNTGQTLIQASTPSYIQSGETISYRYNISNTSYYRIN